MAQPITDAGLREAITERLQAVHVEVTDMSGRTRKRHPDSGSPFGVRQRCSFDRLPRETPMPGNRPPPRARSPPPSSPEGPRSIGGCGQAFTTLIVSPRFQGLTSLKRHRLVNAALRDEIAAIHAWTAKCQTPDEWSRDAAAATPSMAGTVDGRVEGTKD
ncbi:hypothetical protein HIM_03640 [Hirsutella minnesotensis 3608]|uniref:BolA-like protein n=1 Tax=Hirsutella minnesotensis 3608 TaxID=1043627 RepID=A0A0F7ZVK3_9HYPO|nr:hypothetical protein HIM_03640 [Hirsutella minnesotensis 3608]